MNFIENVKIEGFWREKTVNLSFGKSENFLIGVNGSGKTTIINLIAAAIEADFYTLDRIEFNKITVGLAAFDDNKKSRIVVTKEENDKTPYQNILFQIYSGNKKSFEIFLDDLEEDRLYRHRSYERQIRFRNQALPVHKKDLRHKLRELFNTSWLSIHRTNLRLYDDKGHESRVDQKLSEFLLEFTKYLNELNRKSREETDKFQKYIFLSLLSTEPEQKLFQTLRGINLEKEKQSLSQIYSLFKLEPREYHSKLDKYFKEFSKALVNDSISVGDAEYLLGMRRIHSVIEEWQILLNKQDSINDSRNSFMDIINELLQYKELEITERNELVVLTESGKRFHPKFLSSGEKQLLIIFGETLLQRLEPHIFIADEPELSLHIEWQEKLVESLKMLNPKSQMIFATHSPDIVGVYQDSVIKVENCIA